jgi:histone acetyltransferase (RNA polymerase elongator complex component)
MKNEIIPFFVNHQGCPHQCVFCNQRVINSESSKDLVEFDAFISKFIQEKKVSKCERELAFFGGSFTGIDRGLMIEYLKRGKTLLDKGLITRMRCSTRPDKIDKEVLEILKTYGMTSIELGVQSMDNEVLTLSGRGLTCDDIISASHLIKAFGFKLGHQIMIGLPGDTFSSFQQTVKHSIALNPDNVRIYPTQVLKGTKLEDLFESGLYQSVPIEEAIEQAKWAMKLYYKAGVKVIKVGLHANDDLMDPDVRLAGPYHPAFREWVESLMVQESIESVINKGEDSSSLLEIRVHPKWVSRVAGLSQMNKKWLEKNFGRKMSIVQDTSMLSDTLIVTSKRIAHVVSIQNIEK